jgi:hypothetical protein
MATIPTFLMFQTSMKALDESLITTVMHLQGLPRAAATALVNELVEKQTAKALLDLGISL